MNFLINPRQTIRLVIADQHRFGRVRFERIERIVHAIHGVSKFGLFGGRLIEIGRQAAEDVIQHSRERAGRFRTRVLTVALLWGLLTLYAGALTQPRFPFVGAG